ncbi:MAG: DUF2461 domain-containing protein [Chloroflexi bacterium]|nr:DUF2461 domain-containing protein [Chloroflexota bacterium]
MSGAFAGFSDAGLKFLDDLAANNNKEWFEANKQTYISALRDPAIALIAALGERLQTVAPGLRCDTSTNGSGSLMRINRDTRFSDDKTPYKTNIAFMLWEGAGKKTESPAFGMQITSQSGELIAGMFQFPKPLLQAYRDAVIDDRLGAALVEAVESVRGAGDYTISGEHYKRVPRGYDADHPRAEWLRYNALYAHAPAITPPLLTSPDLLEACVEHCVNMAPIQRWLVQVSERATE